MNLIGRGCSSNIYKDGNYVYKFFVKGHKYFMNEIDTYNRLSKLNLPSIVKYDNIDYNKKCIKMKYYPYNLEEYFEGKYDFTLSKVKIDSILETIIYTLKVLHYYNITHGDYKAKNILLDEDFNPVIIDFDLGITGTIDDDIKKLHLLTYQLLYNVSYKPNLYNNYKTKMKELEKYHPFIMKLIK